MHIGLKSDEYEIIAHGQPFLFGKDKDLIIEIAADHDFVFSIVLRFMDDPSGKQKIESLVEQDRIILLCKNFYDKGSGLTAPVKIAVIDQKELYLMFWSFVDGKTNEQSRSVRYTIFMKDERSGENWDE